MSSDKPKDPQTQPEDAALRGRIDKLGDEIDKLEEEALPPEADPPSIGAQLG